VKGRRLLKKTEATPAKNDCRLYTKKYFQLYINVTEMNFEPKTG